MEPTMFEPRLIFEPRLKFFKFGLQANFKKNLSLLKALNVW